MDRNNRPHSPPPEHVGTRERAGKCDECDKLTESIEAIKKNNEKEVSKLKNEIKLLKNNIKVSSAQSNKNKKPSTVNSNSSSNKKLITEYESKISQLEAENSEFKSNLEKIENTQIVEYQKLLDESFDKINDLNKELFDAKERVKYLEKSMKMNESIKETPLKEIRNSVLKESNKTSTFNIDEDIDENRQSETMLGKKRKFLPKIYQTIIDKNITKTPTQSTKENNFSGEISNFQI